MALEIDLDVDLDFDLDVDDDDIDDGNGFGFCLLFFAASLLPSASLSSLSRGGGESWGSRTGEKSSGLRPRKRWLFGMW